MIRYLAKLTKNLANVMSVTLGCILQLVINKQKPFVRFGMMHLMATNICVLIVTAVMETNEDYRQQNYIANNVTTAGDIKIH